MYFEKSFFSIRIKMMARKAVSNSTKTNELIIDNQWISKVVGRKVESAYLAILCEYLVLGIWIHSTVYENTTSCPEEVSVMSTRRLESVVTLADTI